MRSVNVGGMYGFRGPTWVLITINSTYIYKWSFVFSFPLSNVHIFPPSRLFPDQSPVYIYTYMILIGDIYYNAVGALGDEQGNATGTGRGESLESKLEELSSITSVEV